MDDIPQSLRLGGEGTQGPQRISHLVTAALDFSPNILYRAEPYLCYEHDTHLSESMGLNVQVMTPRLKESCIPVQDNTVLGPESELEPRSLVTQSSVGFPRLQGAVPGADLRSPLSSLTWSPILLGFLH